MDDRIGGEEGVTPSAQGESLACTPMSLDNTASGANQSEEEPMPERFQETLKVAHGPEIELVSLDGQKMQSKHLAMLIQQLQLAREESAVIAMSLADNALSDESCALLRDALLNEAFCPSLLTINLKGNPAITATGQAYLNEALKSRPDIKVFFEDRETGSTDDVGLETFKAGAVITEEEQPHARPAEQWIALRKCLLLGASISATSQVMREICDAVGHEISKEEAVDPAEAQAQGGVVLTKKVKLAPGPYCKFAVQHDQLVLLDEVLSLDPAPVQTAASRRPVQGVGSHRFHASALVCLLVRCACDPGHKSDDTPLLLDAILKRRLVSRVAHLALSSPNCSCLHTAFLEAFSVHTLPYMPAAVWQPLLTHNLGLQAVPRGAKVLQPLPALLLEQATKALKCKEIGMRSGLIGMVIQLGRDLQLARDDSQELGAALDEHESWTLLAKDEGPLSRLLLEQEGSLAGGKPNTLSMHGMYEDESLGSQIHLRAIFGIRELAQMHQSLNLGVALHQ